MVVAKKVPKKNVTTKPVSKRVTVERDVFRAAGESPWVVHYGKVTRIKKLRGRTPAAAKTEHLFRVVAEKLPYEALLAVKKHLKGAQSTFQGVYVAHDSMGCPRYIGRGNIFARLEARKKVYSLELQYFSFYVVADKKHEREIETLLIHAAGFLLEFNDKKKRVGIEAGNVNDFEAGTVFYERRYVRGGRP